MVQRRAARWVSNQYSSYNCVTAMLINLAWRSLEYRRYDSRLAMFYKKVQVGNGQEEAQSERNSHSKNRDGKN